MSAWLTSLFANPWMLLWLPTIAVPLVIHLWNRRKYREIQWAAMEYLLAAIMKNSRRMRIEQLLLLLVRTLLLLLVVLALAEPLVRSVAPLLMLESRTHHILVIDGSYSMGYQQAEKQAFDMARERAKEIVRQGEPGDGYSLILMADRAVQVVGQATVNQKEFLEELERLQLREGGADLDAALRAIEEVIEKSQPAEGRWQRHEVLIISDLASNTWSSEGKSPALLGERSDRLARLGQDGVVEVFPVGGRHDANLAVTSVELAESFATTAGPVTITATLHNFSKQMIQQQPVELWVDGRRINQILVDIPAGDTLPVSFQHRFHLPGDHIVSIRAEGDSLAIDNRRLLALPVKEQLDALLVSGKRGSILPLEAALDGGDLSPGLSSEIHPEVVSESKLLERDLEKYDCIFLCNVGQLTAQESQRLRDYLRAGGGLITILGDQVIAEQYNQRLVEQGDDREEDAGGRGIFPARLGEAIYNGQYHFVDPLDYKHPMLSKWKGNPRTGLVTVPVIKYIRLEIPTASEAEVVLGLDTGDPLIVMENVGRGRSLLLATDPSGASRVGDDTGRSWSLIASWLNAQPFFEGLWKAVVGGQFERRNVLVGETITTRLAPAVAMEKIEVRLPTGQTLQLPLKLSDDHVSWSFSETPQSGVYRVSLEQERVGGREGEEGPLSSVLSSGTDRGMEAAAEDGTWLFAVNVDTRESDLDKLNPEDLPEGWNLSGKWQSPDTAVPPTQVASLPLHAFLLWVVLALLFTETFLAWWIGNRSA